MILPSLNELLKAEEKRHHDEVSRITRFHAFMSEFESCGLIGGVPHKLSALGDGVARFTSETGESYFYDAENPASIAVAGEEGVS